MKNALLCAWAATLALAAPLAAQIDPDLLAGMTARSIGPAAMSGRIAAIDAVAADPDVVWVGAATGGVWKSVDGGLTWAPVFDDQKVAAIGAVAVNQTNPDVVWVGTGEGNPRNSVSVGNGIYKSLDGGRTWRHLGLDATERIHRIVLHPRDPDVAWVAALGRAWGENPERGVFKTTDGGKTWRKVLYVDEKTGAADLVVDPANPDKLFAAMWEYRRWPWFFRSGGPGSGLFASHDGGESWRRLTEEDGLPKGDLGRIGVAVAPSDPRIVYALVEAEKSALVRSADGGRTWKAVNTEPDVSNRPFYYADLRVDPVFPDRVYRLASEVDVSTDGGKSFDTLISFGDAHPDHHAMWIDPGDPRHIIEGNDGGVYVSRDRGETWRFASNLPLAQFYHVRVDMETPFNVYGGLQDNGSWKGPSTAWETDGIRNHHWQEVGFGDGFDTVPDPDDPMQGWSMSQEGFLSRWDLRTGERKDVRPPEPEGTPLRFNWNAAIAIDPFASDTIYYGSQFVHRSADRGDTWTTISPDLTTNRKEWQRQKQSGGLTPDVTGAENFTTIIAIAPSPREKGLLWIGTDDGRLHVTRDGGATWTSVEDNVRGVPENTWIPHVEPSPHDPATALVVFDNHRRSDWTPYVYKTTDYGRSWKSLATKDLWGYALSIVQDPVDPDLLFLGTEFGLWASLDGGRSWLPWKHGVPTVSVMDLALHPRDGDLVIATHGRSLFVLDDVAPLRSLSRETMAAKLHLFPVADAVQHTSAQTGSSRFPGQGEFHGESRPYGAIVTYSLNLPGLPHPDEEKERQHKAEERAEARRKPKPAEPEEGAPPERTAAEAEAAREQQEEQEDGRGRPGEGPEVEIRVTDAAGKLIRTFKGPAKLGVNRAVWDLRQDAFKEPPREEPSWWDSGGPEVLPGTYEVTVRFRGEETKGSVRVLPDPRIQVADEARRANHAALMEAGRLQERVATAVERVHRTRADVATLLERAKKEQEEARRTGEEPSAAAKQAAKDLATTGRKLQERLTAIEKKLWQAPDTKGIVASDDALSAIQYASGAISSTWQEPTPAMRSYLNEAERRVGVALAELDEVMAGDVAAFRAKVKETELRLLPEWEPLAQ